MSKFEIRREQSEQTVLLKMSGSIDEDADFSGAEVSGASEIILDMDKVDSINSIGIREWIKWISKTPAGSKIVYKNVPKVIVDQVNMVANFLPSNAQVESFYVPYYSEASGSEKFLLFTKDKEFDEQGNLNPPSSVKDDEGNEMEMDVIEGKYFRFLQK